jgi:hypothetical protein
MNRRFGCTVLRRHDGGDGYGRPRSTLLPIGLVIMAMVAAACSTIRPLTDPGRLEVWNGLRDQLAVIVGGRLYQIQACAVSEFESVELRGVKVTTPTAVVVAEFAADRRTAPMGERRYIVVSPMGHPDVLDLRTKPPFERPAGRNCTLTLTDLMEERGPVRE